MKIISTLNKFLFWVLLLGAFAATITAQTDESDYAFVIFDTTVTQTGVETSDKHPQERRIYVSNIVAFPNSDPALFRRASKVADDYFTATVVDPMKVKGILHQYYDDAIHINNSVVFRLDTKADVEEVRGKALEGFKEQNANVFTFTWIRDAAAGGLEMSKPVLVQHKSTQPLFGTVDSKMTVETGPTPKTPKKRPGTK